MAKQSAVDSLKESIRLLEIRQAQEGELLKEQFRITYESLKPVNLIKNSLKDIVSSTEVKTSLLETVVALVSGYITQKIVTNSKSNIFIKLIGVLLQYGVTNFISKNAETIRIFISDLIDRYSNPPENEQEIIPDPEV